MENFYSEYIIPYEKQLVKVIKKIKTDFNNHSLSTIFLRNVYEFLVPYNFWFYHPDYKIVDHLQNNQMLRLRYYAGLLLTPLVISKEYSGINHLLSYLPFMTLYQPFYPETFYEMYEILNQEFLDLLASSPQEINTTHLHISFPDNIGGLEAQLVFKESTNRLFRTFTFSYWPAGCESIDLEKGIFHYVTQQTCYNYLQQIHNIQVITDSENLQTYDFISIDLVYLLSKAYKKKNEEEELEINLFYFILALEHLKNKGTVVIKLNMICRPNWYYLFDICKNFFEEHNFIRPKNVNIYHGIIYLVLLFFKEKTFIKYQNKHMDLSIIKNLYIQKNYQLFHTNFKMDVHNFIRDNYLKAREKWIEDLENTRKTLNQETQSNFQSLNTWCHVHNLPQIKCLTPHVELRFVDLSLPAIYERLTFSVQYSKIRRRKQTNDLILKLFKRVMDTKPSYMFMENNKIKNKIHQKEFITWDELTELTNTFKDLNKYVSSFQAEIVTNAWFKMYEMIHQFPELLNKKKLKTFHLCELPGSFISAINHYLSDKEVEWKWYAQSLKPINLGGKNELAVHDRYHLVKEYPHRWIFEKDGDITKSNVIKAYASHPELDNIHFMTSDAGHYCPPQLLNEQESYMGKLLMGQILAILACLSSEGSAIFKTFLPLVEPLTISLFKILSNHFEELHFLKPMTSHPYNSEVYILVKNYSPISKSHLNYLYTLLDDSEITTNYDLFQDWVLLKQYIKHINQLMINQIEHLKRNYYFYYHLDEFNEDHKNLQKWIDQNPIVNLKKSLFHS